MDSNRKRGKKRYVEEKLIDKGSTISNQQDPQNKEDIEDCLKELEKSKLTKMRIFFKTTSLLFF